jgi:undecaprenyl-diphosphatase
MSILQAIILGIVQGLTEFIPISSTAHLVFASRILGLYEGAGALRNEQTTATIAVIQLGTLFAVIVYFARDIWNIMTAFVRDHLALVRGQKSEAAMDVTMVGARQSKLSEEAWLGWLVIIGSIPIGTVGLLLKKVIEGPLTKNLWVIATMMILVALLLVAAEFVNKRMAKRREMSELGIKDALAVGGAQVLALIPGTSRSGATIMAGLFAGETRETAARFSFLLSIPAIAASGLLELKEAIEKLPDGTLLPLVIATIVSGMVGYASIWFLLRFLRTHSTGVFIVYRLIVGVIIFALLIGGFVNPYYESEASSTEKSAAEQQNSNDAPKPQPSLLPQTGINTNNNSKDSVNFSRPSSKRSRGSSKRTKRQ